MSRVRRTSAVNVNGFVQVSYIPPPAVGKMVKRSGYQGKCGNVVKNKCQRAIEPPYGGGRVDMQSYQGKVASTHLL